MHAYTVKARFACLRDLITLSYLFSTQSTKDTHGEEKMQTESQDEEEVRRIQMSPPCMVRNIVQDNDTDMEKLSKFLRATEDERIAPSEDINFKFPFNTTLTTKFEFLHSSVFIQFLQEEYGEKYEYTTVDNHRCIVSQPQRGYKRAFACLVGRNEVSKKINRARIVVIEGEDESENVRKVILDHETEETFASDNSKIHDNKKEETVEPVVKSEKQVDDTEKTCARALPAPIVPSTLLSLDEWQVIRRMREKGMLQFCSFISLNQHACMCASCMEMYITSLNLACTYCKMCSPVWRCKKLYGDVSHHLIKHALIAKCIHFQNVLSLMTRMKSELRAEVHHRKYPTQMCLSNLQYKK